MSQNKSAHEALGGRPTVRSINGMVAAAHPLAAQGSGQGMPLGRYA